MNPDDPKVFDVKKSSPSPASKPIITGHRPTMPDPMLHRIPVETAEPEVEHQTSQPAPGQVIEPPNAPTPPATPTMPDLATNSPQAAPVSPPATAAPELPPKPVDPSAPAELPVTSTAEPPVAPQPLPHISQDLKVELPAGEAAHHRRSGLWVVVAIIAIVIGVVVFYLVS